jgi:hypothetical protein
VRQAIFLLLPSASSLYTGEHQFMDISESTADLAIPQKRLEKLLQDLARRGLSQNDVARRCKIPAPYLTDLKKGNRPLTELFARRLAEAFGVDHQWLLGEVGTMDSLVVGQEVAVENLGSMWLPVFPHPIVGEPRSLPKWDGSSVEVCGAEVARARLATHPYILRFGHDDQKGRLRRDDLLLVSQSVEESAEFQVVKHATKAFLARRLGDGQFQRVADGSLLPAGATIVGHVMGIVWAAL